MNSRINSRYYAAIRYLEGMNNIYGSYQSTDLTGHPRPEIFIERMQNFLDRIGNPEDGFKYVHITGTAGKGSVSSLVQATLVSCGKKTGLFTSPFTVSTIEKIQVGDKYIDPVSFADITESLKPHIDAAAASGYHGTPSYFEIIFAIALVYFRQEKCEYVVLEVGLGGRYDSTNIIKRPLLTAITNIGLDHTKVLGETKDKIAWDKAGIIKNGSHFFTTEDESGLLDIFRKECEIVGASYHSCDVRGLDYEQRNELLAGSMCADLGIIKSFKDISIPDHLPARFEIVEKDPLVIIDGAHNVSKLQSTVYNLAKLTYKRLILVVAISADKDWRTMMELLLPKADRVFVTRFSFPGRRCVDPKELMKSAEERISKPDYVRLYTDPVEAFKEAKKTLAKEDLLLVTGSFYLAGDIRLIYCPEEQILRQRNSRIRVSGIR